MDPKTTMTPDDATLHLPIRVVSVKASDHKWYGAHDLIVVELTQDAGDLPAGLHFQVRRPHDGTADLRSDERKAKQETVKASPSMSKPQLLALAKEREVEVPAKATKADILGLLA